MKKVLILFGGNSPEHYVSCKSAKSILENIDKNKFIVTSVGITQDGIWYLYDQSLSYLENGSWADYAFEKIDNIIEFLKSFDVVFEIIHGGIGEDGKLQGLFDTFNIKYVGSNTSSSVVGMNKYYSKLIFAAVGIPQVPYIRIDKNYNIKNIMKKMKFPVIVKPENGGSSIGISKANNKKELVSSIKTALKYDPNILIEKDVVVRELECSVLESKKLIVSTIGEIKSSNELYDYDAKYYNDLSYTIIPAKLNSKTITEIKHYSKLAFKSVGGKGLSRVDFFYDELSDKVYLNEINTLPGFTTISMYPKLLIYDKLTYSDIITILINNA